MINEFWDGVIGATGAALFIYFVWIVTRAGWKDGRD